MTVLLRGVAILPGEGPFIPRGFILIDGDRIEDLGPGDGPARDVRPEREVRSERDGPGLVAIPGLINAHTHLALTSYRGIADDVRLFDFLVETRKRWGTATPEEALEAAMAGCRAAVRSGTTCLVDSHATSPRPAAAAARRVGVRLVGAAAARSTWFGEPATDTLPMVLRETDATVAEYARDDLMFVPSLAAHSPYNCSGDQIRQVKAICRERGWLFAIHLAECEEEVELIRRWHGLTPAAYLDSLGVLDDRSLLAHCVYLTEDDVRVLAKRGSHVTHCPKSNAKLGDGIAPIPSCLRAGVSVALGTDSMVSNNNLDMLEEMRFGVLIHRALHQAPTVLTAREIFEMATIRGARALGLTDQIGSLRPGKRADIALLALDPPQGLTEESVLSELIFHATVDAVRTVIVNGEIILDAGGSRGPGHHLVAFE
ncbi:MAG: amidohydrolase family protein [Armatimonadota bacterium]